MNAIADLSLALLLVLLVALALACAYAVRLRGQRATAEAEAAKLAERVRAAEAELTQALARAEVDRDLQTALLDGLPIAVWRRNSDLNLVYCNRAYARAVDREPEAVVREGIELPGKAQARATREVARRALEGDKGVTESLHVVVAGERRLLKIHELPFAVGGETGLLGLALDRTPEEDLQAELKRHIAAHADVLEALGSGIAILGPDLRLKFHNSAYTQIWGLEEESLGNEPHLNDIYELLRERRKLPEQLNFPAFKKDQVRMFSTLIEPREDLMHLPDGTTLRRIVTPHPFGGVLFTFEDVTDRLALERSYNTLIAVQQETLENLLEGVAVYGADGRLKLHNQVYARLWGLDDADLQGEPHVRELIPRVRPYFRASDEDWPKLMDRMAARATEPKTRLRQSERADGSSVRWAQLPLPDGNNLFTFLDVTNSTRVERALRERNEALETTDRLKSEFIANVSYELRTPLNTIVGFAEILQNQYFGELNERQSEYSAAIVESSQRLLTLINDILDLASIEAGYLKLDLDEVDLCPLLHSVQTLGYERARNCGVELRLDCAENIGTQLADERRLKQALFNLVSNALKFTPEGGNVTIAASRRESGVELSVTDTGVGIPEVDHDRVFETFERAGTGRHSGAGLGLSLVKNLIELHGGVVKLDSLPGEGTRIICFVPNRPPSQDGDTEAEDETIPLVAGEQATAGG